MSSELYPEAKLNVRKEPTKSEDKTCNCTKCMERRRIAEQYTIPLRLQKLEKEICILREEIIKLKKNG